MVKQVLTKFKLAVVLLGVSDIQVDIHPSLIMPRNIKFLFKNPTQIIIIITTTLRQLLYISGSIQILVHAYNIIFSIH